MERLAARLPITLSTFLFGLVVTAALTKAPAADDVPTPFRATRLVAPPPPAATPDGRRSEPARAADKTPRVSQQQIVNFPGVGRVRVSALETFGESTHLEFNDAETGKLLDSEYVGDGEPDTYLQDSPFLRFRVLHIKGLPDPMVVGVGVAYGGSDDGWQSVAIGAVDGEFRGLTSETLEASNQGGFYYGDLGGGRGLGAASWNFVWDYDDEGHYGAHRYELKVYKWSAQAKRFEWYQVLRTRAKFDSGERAVRSLGYRLKDVRKSFPDFADFGLE